MREFIYGVILGAFGLWFWVATDIGGKWGYLTNATQQNARVSGNWGSKP